MSTRFSTKIASLMLIATAALSFGCTRIANHRNNRVESRASDGLDRTVLPIPEPKRQTYKELDARNAKAPARWEVKAPAGCPKRRRRLDRRHRLWCVQHVWRTDQYADAGKGRANGTQIQSLSHDGIVFTDARRVAHRL